jgi:hypothetical protein
MLIDFIFMRLQNITVSRNLLNYNDLIKMFPEKGLYGGKDSIQIGCDTPTNGYGGAIGKSKHEN